MFNTETLARSLPEQIADRLRTDLLCGRLQAGEQVLESDLIARFGVSRTPIRSALVALTQEGLLESRSHSSVRVSARSPDAIIDLIVVIRRNVETFALRSFFSAISKADFDAWDEILAKLKKACAEKDYPAIAEHDLAFHRSIVRRSGFTDLEAVWMSIFVRVRHHFLDSQRKYKDPMTIWRDHVKVVKAFRTGDVDAAAKALSGNIE